MGKMAYEIYNGEISEGQLVSYDSMTIYDGGIASNTTVGDQGYVYVSSGGSAVDTQLVDYSYIGACQGAVISNTIMSGWGASASVEVGGSAYGTEMQEGGSFCVAGGYASDTLIGSYGSAADFRL
jgi:autotransporter passenger strand-loop-strand repeat protein